MAEIAALANLAGVICYGLKLSMALYDFATSLGTAGKEIKTLGTDVILFCSVLKQVQSTLGQATKSFRVSSNAIQTTQDILNQSSNIFDELFRIFAKLQKDEKLPVDFLTRVRWTFKRAKVLFLRESLHSCTAMLHLMLTTMSFAQRIASKGTAFDDEAEDDDARALTHSLCLAQQITSDRLAELEKQCLVEESYRSDSALTMLANEQEDYKPCPHDGDFDESMADVATSEIVSDTVTVESGIRAAKLTSLLQGTVSEEASSCKKNKRLTWSSISSQQQSILESDSLLRDWTDQRDPLAWEADGSEDESVTPSDSVSRYHQRSHSESTANNVTTFLESTNLTLKVTGESTPFIKQRPKLTTTRSAEDAAYRSRQKVIKLTGEDYAVITADWMWRVNERTGPRTLIPLPSLETPIRREEASEPRKRSKHLRWINNSSSPNHPVNFSRGPQVPIRSDGLLS